MLRSGYQVFVCHYKGQRHFAELCILSMNVGCSFLLHELICTAKVHLGLNLMEAPYGVVTDSCSSLFCSRKKLFVGRATIPIFDLQRGPIFYKYAILKNMHSSDREMRLCDLEHIYGMDSKNVESQLHRVINIPKEEIKADGKCSNLFKGKTGKKGDQQILAHSGRIQPLPCFVAHWAAPASCNRSTIVGIFDT